MPAMQITPRPLVGIACVIGAATLWGTTGTSQALAGGNLSPAWFGALRLAFAAMFFLAFAAMTGATKRQAWKDLAPSDVVGAGLCMAVYNLAFFAGVRLTGVGIGTAIALGSGPIWAGLLQAAFQRQMPTTAWWTGTGVAIVGGVLLSLGGGALTFSATGMLLCLAAGFSYAVYTLLNKRMVGRAPAASITLGAFTLAALISLPAAGLQAGMPAITVRELLAAAYAGLVTAGVGYLLFSHALRHIAPATSVTLALTEPVVAYGLAALVLGEPTNATAVAGLALVVSGVLGVVRVELTAVSRPVAPQGGGSAGRI
jgi:DME family drug/metabolite transporter